MKMKKKLATLCLSVLTAWAADTVFAETYNTFTNDMEKELNLTDQWDKVSPKSPKVTHAKITFHNRYGITLAADLYIPLNAEGKLPAVAVSGPFGAVKEQSSGLYAQTLRQTGIFQVPEKLYHEKKSDEKFGKTDEAEGHSADNVLVGMIEIDCIAIDQSGDTQDSRKYAGTPLLQRRI